MKKIFLSFIFIISIFLGGFNFSSAADLGFTSGALEYKAGDYISVDVLIANNTQAINAISGKISFPQNTLSVVSLSRDGSIIRYWTADPSYSNGAGSINFEGIVPNPGFSGSRGKILTIRFLAKSKGSATVLFTEGSVLANDGLATEVVGLLKKINFSITEKATTVPVVENIVQKTEENIIPEPTTKVVSSENSSLPIITSTTNPDQTIWYSNNSPVFNWSVPKGVSGVRMSYDNDKDGKPSSIYPSSINSKSFTNLKDGVYYLHVQFKNNKNWGDIASYKFQIDTSAPEVFMPLLSYTEDGIPALNFKTEDSGSGIDHYEILVDKETSLFVNPDEAGSPYILPKSSPGSHTVVLSAVDKAGNITSISVPVFFMKKIAGNSLFSDYRFLAVLGLFIIMTILFIWSFLTRSKASKGDAHKYLEGLMDSIRGDFDMLRDNFDIHNASITKATSTSEKTFIKKIFKTSKDHIDLVERDIDHKIKNIKDKV